MAGVVSADVGGGLAVYDGAALEYGPLAGGGGVLGSGYYDRVCLVGGGEALKHIGGRVDSRLRGNDERAPRRTFAIVSQRNYRMAAANL